MSKRQKMSSQQVMKVLFEIDDKVSSEDEDDFDDELNLYESDPEMDALSDLNSETDGSDTELKTKIVLFVKKFEKKMDICGGRKQRMQEEHQGEISSQAHQVRKVKGLRQTRP